MEESELVSGSSLVEFGSNVELLLLLSVELFVNSVEACVLPVGLLVKSGLIVVALASEELVSVSVEFVFD